MKEKEENHEEEGGGGERENTGEGSGALPPGIRLHLLHLPHHPPVPSTEQQYGHPPVCPGEVCCWFQNQEGEGMGKAGNNRLLCYGHAWECHNVTVRNGH